VGEENSVVDETLLIANTQTLAQIVIDYQIDEIVIAIDDRRKAMPLKELLDCKALGVQIMDLLSFYEREQGLIYLDGLTLSWFLFSDGFDFSGFRTAIKRTVDIVASLVLLVLTWPFMLLTALAIMLETHDKSRLLH
jgi:hypothetical protein